MTQPDDHHFERQQERDQAVEAIEHALSTIEAVDREPDQWERAFLVQAIGWLFRGGYRLATLDAELALTPWSERSSSTLRSDPLVDGCTVSLLRAAFRDAMAEPLRDFTIFGRIVFT